MKKTFVIALILCGIFAVRHVSASVGTGIGGGGGTVITLPIVFCGSYPCLRTNTDGDCTMCDCSSVTCPSGQVTNATCGCISSGSSGGGGTTICAKGEYYNDANILKGCIPCPFGGTTSSDMVAKPPITSCYIPAGQDVTDETGTYTFTSDCHYTK